MWSTLALFILARPCVLEKCGSFAQRSILVNRKRSHAAAVVIRSEQPLPGLVDSNMTRSGSARRKSIEQLQGVGGGVDCEGADAAGGLTVIHRDLIRRIEKAMVRMNRQERWIFRLRHQA